MLEEIIYHKGTEDHSNRKQRCIKRVTTSDSYRKGLPCQREHIIGIAVVIRLSANPTNSYMPFRGSRRILFPYRGISHSSDLRVIPMR